MLGFFLLLFQDLVTASIALEPGGLNYDLLIGRLSLLAFQKVVPNLLVRSENIDTNKAGMYGYFLGVHSDSNIYKTFVPI